MDLQQHIKHYLDNNEFAKWNLLGLLQYLATIIIYTNEDVDDIILVFKDQLKLLSGLQNLTKSARNKAIKLSDNLEAHRK
ncbi:19430_t:CDS:1, partial [Entrophospora sp. SA101]